MSKNIITINRGDSFDFNLVIEDESSPNNTYILKDKDIVYFGLMDPHQPFEHALVKKRYTGLDADSAGNLSISLEPQDTLDLVPGVYYYSIKLLKASEFDKENNIYTKEKVITVINKTKFIIND